MQPPPPQLNTIEDVILWASHHDGQINAWWSAQFLLNTELQIRLAALERRIWLMSGAGAVIGSLMGTLIPYLLGNHG